MPRSKRPDSGGRLNGHSQLDYGPAGMLSADDFKGTLSGYIYGGSGWQGDYSGYHYLVATGSIPPTTAEQGKPGSWSPRGEIIVVKGPRESAPANSTPGKPQQLIVPSTPGPLHVVSVQLPNVTVVGPAGAKFVVNLSTGVVTPG